jgi:hypothetical protein
MWGFGRHRCEGLRELAGEVLLMKKLLFNIVADRLVAVLISRLRASSVFSVPLW